MPSAHDDTLLHSFLRYVAVDTQSSEESTTFPSTAKQKDLIKLLSEELRALGVTDVTVDEYGYLYAGLRASPGAEHTPAIALLAHVDTSPACSGSGVMPRLHEQYDGSPILLEQGVVLDPNENPPLAAALGDTIITADGTTLLGADDKAGVAEIMEVVRYLLTHPEHPHGPVRVVFTVDEEVGTGTAHIELEKIRAAFAYTLDGSEVGELEDETFNADSMTVDITGISVHPGTAKGIMVNAIKVAAHLLSLLPADRLSPETTEEREGFLHPHGLTGSEEKASIHFIVRDFTREGLAAHERFLEELVAQTAAAWPKAVLTTTRKESYRNMKEAITPEVVELAEQAMRTLGIQPIRRAIRGGTDGSRLTFMGLPTPNLFTGGYNYHGRREYAVLSHMHKAVEVVLEILRLATVRR
ncbi:MAG: peptidase T [Deltaproteobacteria bacterium RIFOXYA12_FULL_61_11]|nr:MAG: peptidase T [Deltaproteobacteria bacterium RIFOXYA12_FULL_61_11]